MEGSRIMKWITVDNETHCLKDWSKIKNLSPNTICMRIKIGWTEAQAIKIPKKDRRDKYDENGDLLVAAE